MGILNTLLVWSKMFINSLLKYSQSGFKNVSHESKIYRLNICYSCELYDIKFNRCLSCGCFVNIKTSWATEKCPLDKWSAEIATEQNQEQSPHQTQNSSQKPGGCACNK